MILKRLELGGFAANCYIVGDEVTKEGMIIDPGAEGDLIMAAVKTLGLRIKYIVLTHGHMDHTGALAEVKESTGASLAVHQDEARLVGGRAGPFSVPVSRPDLSLRDGDTIQLGKQVFTVIHTPGHTPGGICLHTDGVVFTGDTLFNFGIGRADFPGASYEQELTSIRERLMTLPEDTVAYPGHGPETRIGIEKRGNPFLNGAF